MEPRALAIAVLELARRPAGLRVLRQPAKAAEDQPLTDWALPALLVYALGVGTYFVVRYSGLWSEIDSASQALTIRAVALSRSLIPENSDVYPLGFAYAAISNALLAFTGIKVSALQQIISPLLSALLVFPAWALFQELTGSRRTAALATLLLFAQPEFLFVVLRGSHERVLRALMLVALLLLVRSFRFRHDPARFALHVELLYLAAFGLIATNAFFGMSFIAACSTAMVVAWALGRWRLGLMRVASRMAGRLAYASLTCAGLGLIFIFYLYPPATGVLQVLQSEIDKLATLFLTTEGSRVNPYSSVVSGWTSLPVYFLVSIGDYLLIVASAPIWIWYGWRWMRSRTSPLRFALIREQPRAVASWLLWLLYGAFAAQGALGVAADLIGVLGQNLQHRSFPSFAIVATPLLATSLSQLRAPRWGAALCFAGLAVLAGLALIKASNEPSLSNKWTFYLPAEARALSWVDEHERSSVIWVGLDERLAAAFAVSFGASAQKNEWDISKPKSETRAFLISDVTRMQSARLRRPLPAVTWQNRVYDSGIAQLYRLRARTPFQR